MLKLILLPSALSLDLNTFPPLTGPLSHGRYLTRWSIDSVKPFFRTGLKWSKRRMPVGDPVLKDNVQYGVRPLYLKH